MTYLLAQSGAAEPVNPEPPLCFSSDEFLRSVPAAPNSALISSAQVQHSPEAALSFVQSAAKSFSAHHLQLFLTDDRTLIPAGSLPLSEWVFCAEA